jgi:hypothetical protein
MSIKLITALARETSQNIFFQTDEQNIVCLNRDFPRFLKIWLVLPWLPRIEIEMSSEV